MAVRVSVQTIDEPSIEVTLSFPNFLDKAELAARLAVISEIFGFTAVVDLATGLVTLRFANKAKLKYIANEAHYGSPNLAKLNNESHRDLLRCVVDKALAGTGANPVYTKPGPLDATVYSSFSVAGKIQIPKRTSRGRS